MQYTGIRAEHLAVRNGVGVFDVSHMGQVEIRGPERCGRPAAPGSNDVRRIPVGGAQYSLLCNEGGGVLDDLFTYWLARQLPHCHQRLESRARPPVDTGTYADLDVDVKDRIDDFVMLAVQGPDARALVRPSRRRAAAAPHALLRAHRRRAPAMLVCGTGYTGEDGVELLIDPERRDARLGRAARARRHAGRPRRARHAAPGGLLPPLRQRPERGP